MKFGFLVILTLLSTDPLRVTKINRMKAEAKDAFRAGDYAGAAKKYTVLVDSMGVNEDEVLLNLAHAYYLQKDTANAFPKYQALTQSGSPRISSRAFNQVALMLNQRGKAEQALQHFKIALKADPTNEEARYNYEMLKKKLDDKKKQEEKNDQQKNQEPSEFAKKLKAQADKLVAEKRYRDAFDLMMNGMKQDKTVSSFEKYIQRIKDVAEIDQ